MDRKRIGVAVALLLVGAVLSGLLLMQHHGEAWAVSAVGQVCGDGQTSGCEVVAQSEYSSFAGVPLAAYGVFFYLSLLALLILASQAGGDAPAWAARAAFFLTAAALALDVVLFGIQAFQIKAFCKLCLATYAVNGGALLALWPARRSLVAANRLVLTGSWVASLAILGGVAGWNAALAGRAEARGKSVLGAHPASGPGRLEDALAEIQRLKGTLDDPQKYQQYLSDKAAKEFDAAVAQTIDTEGIPFKGPREARIQVVEFSDFLCPFCRAIAGAFKEFVPQSQGRVAVYFKNYPLDKECNNTVQDTIHPGACWMARGALCAASQGKFWEYHDKVFEAPPRDPKKGDVLRIAGAAGLNASSLDICLSSPDTDVRLKAQIAEANGLGVKATPSLFINGKKLPRVNDFLAMVDKEGARLGLPPLAKPAATQPKAR